MVACRRHAPILILQRGGARRFANVQALQQLVRERFPGVPQDVLVEEELVPSAHAFAHARCKAFIICRLLSGGVRHVCSLSWQ